MARKHIVVYKYNCFWFLNIWRGRIPAVESLEDSLNLHPAEEAAPKQKKSGMLSNPSRPDERAVESRPILPVEISMLFLVESDFCPLVRPAALISSARITNFNIPL